ncbi:MAG: ABC transporter permease, partial [bacterium]
MIKNYLKITIRNLSKHKFYSAINIFGLAIGLASCLLIFLYVTDELSYDRFHEKADSIYRVNWDFKWNNNEGIGAGTPPPLAVKLVNEIPEIKATTRIYPISDMIVRYEDKFFTETRILGVDPNFFDFFTVEVLAGNPATALSTPNSVILTREMAQKYFGPEPALGKILFIGEDKTDFAGPYSKTFKVTGVVEALPHNSHFQFDLLTSMSSHPRVKYFDWSWVWMQVVTYAMIEDPATISAIEAKIPAMVEKHGQATFKVIGTSYDELINSGGRWNFVFQPLTDIHLGSANIGNRLGPVGNRMYVYLFSVIAVFVLLIACINFMNLSTARSANRAKEVGVRKVLGSVRRTLVAQFITESMLFSVLAMLIAIGLTELFLPQFNQIAGKNLELNLLQHGVLPLFLLCLTLFVGLAAGSYPGLYLSSFRPVEVLTGKIGRDGKKSHLRNLLVVFQFAISIGLIICTLLVKKQMDYVRQVDLGFNKEGLIVISNENNRLGNQAVTFKEIIKNKAQVVNATISTAVPPFGGFQDFYKINSKG